MSVLWIVCGVALGLVIDQLDRRKLRWPTAGILVAIVVVLAAGAVADDEGTGPWLLIPASALVAATVLWTLRTARTRHLDRS